MQSKCLTIVLAQQDYLVGDIDGNTAKSIQASRVAAKEKNADLIVFPELAMTGYPPEDLLLRDSLEKRIARALDSILAFSSNECPDLTLVIGHPRSAGEGLFNSASVIAGGKVIGIYDKQCLPNYRVFDEKRYFKQGDAPLVLPIEGVMVGISICEDIWFDAPVEQAVAAGAELIINLNASPYHREKQGRRKQLLSGRARNNQVPIVYVNLVGGQDELVFDGGSLLYDAQGRMCFSAPQFQEGLYTVQLGIDQVAGRQNLVSLNHSEPPASLSVEASVYQALVLGVRDYVNKNRFKSVVMGLSGGIDSALTLAIAVDALGKDRVHAIMMPFRYTSEMSIEDARKQAMTLGVKYDVFSIEPMYQAFMQTLAEPFEGLAPDTTEENLQARCRAVLLMSLSNKTGALVLTTGNKSEIAVGYSTLYGDMAGGFDVLKDVPKTLVYRLSEYRNTLSCCIPKRVIERPPSAELAPGQKDQDSLPDYDILDGILALYVEQDLSAESIIAKGYARQDVERVVRLVDINEYKRRQAPIGVRISQRGFGKDRRYPITNGWRLGD